MELNSRVGQVKCENKSAGVFHWIALNWTSGSINNIRQTEIKLTERLAVFKIFLSLLTQQDRGNKVAENAVDWGICPARI